MLDPYLQDIGAGKGKNYAVNFPLRDGIDDDAFETIYKPVYIMIDFYFTMMDFFICLTEPESKDCGQPSFIIFLLDAQPDCL